MQLLLEELELSVEHGPQEMKADKGVKVKRFRDIIQSRKVKVAIVIDIGQLELKLGRIAQDTLEGSI